MGQPMPMILPQNRAECLSPRLPRPGSRPYYSTAHGDLPEPGTLNAVRRQLAECGRQLAVCATLGQAAAAAGCDLLAESHERHYTTLSLRYAGLRREYEVQAEELAELRRIAAALDAADRPLTEGVDTHLLTEVR